MKRFALYWWQKNRNLEMIRILYESAFPSDERRSFEELKYIITTKSSFHAKIYKKEADLLGFIFYWKFTPSYFRLFTSSFFHPFCYIEHFAISKQFRCQGFGKKLLQEFCNKTKLPIILEVEKSNNEIAQRRILFYEKLGFKVSDFPYIQPAYSSEKQAVPMLLMYKSDINVETAAKIFKEKVYKK